MARKAKTRFCVEYSGSLRELFSVIEHKDSSLLLTLRHAEKVFDISEIDAQDTKEQHYSIHLSNNSPDNIASIKHTLLTKQDGKFESYLHTPAIRMGNIQPMFARCAPNLSADNYSPKTHSNDIAIPIWSMDENKSTLLYMVCVSSFDAPPPTHFSDGPYVGFRYGFTKLAITVFFCCSNIPSASKGHYMHYASKAPLVNRIPSEPKDASAVVEGFSPTSLEFPLFVYKHFRVLHEIAVDIAAKEGAPNEFLWAIKRVGPGMFTQDEFMKKVGEIVSRGV